MKRLLFLLLTLCAMVFPARAQEAQVPPAVRQARQSVVRLYGMGTNTETRQHARWTGTGFAVGIAGRDSDIFLTNWHVATGSGKYADGQVELWLLQDDAQLGSDLRPLPGSGIRCRVLIAPDGYPDVAVIQALEPVPGHPALPLLPAAQAADGASVFALGYPGLQSGPDGADSGLEDGRITSGTIQAHRAMTQAGGSDSIIHSAPIVHGFSGGPLVNDQGAVVALNTYGFQEDVSTELFCALDISYGIALLDRLNLPRTVLGEPSGRLAFRLLPAAGILGLGSLAMLIFVRRGRKALRQPRKRKEDAHED